MAFFPGRAATLTVAGTAKPIDTIEFNVNGEPVDVTNFTSAGWQEIELGIKAVKLTMSGPYNGIGSGAAASDFVGASATVVFDCDGAGIGTAAMTVVGRITSAKISTTVRGAAQIAYEFESNGVPTLTY